MFKSTNNLNAQKGFTFVDVMITLIILSISIYFFMQAKKNSIVQDKVIKNKNNELLINEYIVSETAYMNSCLNNLKLSNSEIINIINATQGNLTLLSPDNALIKQNETNNYFKLKINAFLIKNISLVKSSFGYKFYSGEIYLETTNVEAEKKLGFNIGDLNFIVNDIGVVLACSSYQNLQEHPDYKAIESANI